MVRAIEQQGINQKRRLTPIDGAIVVGITTNKEALRRRIENRAELMFENGMVEEAKDLGERFGWQNEAMTANIYRLVKQYVDGVLTDAELHNKVILSDWHLAKRQLTWLKRNQFIQWLPLNEVEQYIAKRLAVE